MKIRIKQEGALTKVLLDEKDVSSRLTAVRVELKVGHVPTVRLEILPDEIEIEGDFEVLKKIKDDESRKVNLRFSIGDIKAEIGTDEFEKEVSKHLGEILHGIDNQAL